LRGTEGAGMRRKVTVVGSGAVGATTAQYISQWDITDVVLVDIIEGKPQGVALDLLQAGPVMGYDSLLTGSNGYDETADSDVIVITSGSPRRPGMSRDDLLQINMNIVGGVTREAAKRSPNAIIIVVTNPLDAMCHVALNESGFPKERVLGQAGVLDTARFRTFIAQELDVSVEDVAAYVLGGHGDTMVPLVRYCTVGGVPVSELIPEDRLQEIVQRTRDGGAEIVNLLGTSAYYAPGAASAEMVKSILLDKKRILPCAAYLDGEYGVNGVYVGVPVKLGAGGIEQIIEIQLNTEERAMFDKSADAVRGLVDDMERLSKQPANV
jgi:malate dehydrogenase